MNPELTLESVTAQIPATKRVLRAQIANFNATLRALEDSIEEEAEAIRSAYARGEQVVPEFQFADIVANKVPTAQIAALKQRGVCVVRGVFSRAQAEAWNEELVQYIEENDYYTKAKSKAGMDQYFSQLAANMPQIFGLYWSRPQVMARQSPELAATRAFLNSLWHSQDADFDPNQECTYADRVRRRAPGDSTLGLSLHMDGGSIERWVEPSFQRVYRHVFSGNWQAYDPWDATGRMRTREIPSPAVCRMWRTYQGWTALTPQGPGDGTLNWVPIARGLSYMLLRALADDVAEDDLCGARGGRALVADEKFHAPLMRARIPIPHVNPGDTVWWHPDILHAVEDAHTGTGYSNVMYIGAAPYCRKNAEYLALQRPCFETGRSAPDFAPEDYEVDFKGRATVADLTALGRAQLGF